jgi:hypothetical protein|tara:strand:+ start:5762 stop:6112 length:351 start_codon:yes stop_codon:yes gene_type:complete
MNKTEADILTEVEQDIKALKKELNETVKAIVDGGYSEFPILLAHADDIAIAQKVIEKDVYQTHFHFSASTLEEMVTRKIILSEKQGDFEKQMKANANSFCILLVHPDSMKFIFTPK